MNQSIRRSIRCQVYQLVSSKVIVSIGSVSAGACWRGKLHWSVFSLYRTTIILKPQSPGLIWSLHKTVGSQFMRSIELAQNGNYYRNVVSFSTSFNKYLNLTVFPDVDPIEVICGVSQWEAGHPLINVVSTLSGHASYTVQLAQVYLKWNGFLIRRQNMAYISDLYIITKSMRALWLIDQLWVLVPVNPRKNRASSELLYKSNRPQVSMVYKLINHLGCWQNTRRIRKPLACGS